MIRLPKNVQSVIVALVIVLVFGIVLVQRSNSPAPETTSTFATSSRPQIHDENLKPQDCYIDLDRIHSYGYNAVQYARWEIAVERTKKFDKFSDRLDVPIPAFEELQTPQNSGRKPLEACTPNTRITAPMPRTVDASHILFGVSTTQRRLAQSLDAFAAWAGGTNARLFAMVEPGITTSLQQRAAELDIHLTLIESSADEVLDRYIPLTRTLLENRDSKSQWGVIIDDDTFFPSMPNLVNRLATYDTSVPQYVGASTEDVKTISIHGFMAYGGAGIFLSMPLLEEIDKHHEECAQLPEEGDKRIAYCIYFYTTTKLTWDHGLFQLDFQQIDASGFYESGRPLPLSLHHWKSPSWYPVDVQGMNQVSSVCGDNCQLQRWRVGESNNWFFVNGFSIIQHSYPINDTIGLEQTWDDRDADWAFSLGPFRPKDPEKESFRLQESVMDSPGHVRQFYVHNQLDGPKVLPKVIEVVWRVTKLA